MAHFIRISLLENLGEMKINLDNVTTIVLNKGEDNHKMVSISFIDGNVIKLIEDIHILDANQYAFIDWVEKCKKKGLKSFYLKGRGRT